MKKRLRPIFWVESTLAALIAILIVATFIRNDWIEAIFHVDPDGGNGSFEKVVIGVLFVITLALFTLASFEWRRWRKAQTATA
ncbi:MAG: ABC transporter permease [Rhabdochlamydiaceae bacterium]